MARAAENVAAFAVEFDLPDVTPDRLPPPDLPPILVRQTPAHVVAAVPLEPAARIVGMDPTLAAPFGERLRGVDAEAVERGIVALGAELRAIEPRLGGGKLFCEILAHAHRLRALSCE